MSTTATENKTDDLSFYFKINKKDQKRYALLALSPYISQELKRKINQSIKKIDKKIQIVPITNMAAIKNAVASKTHLIVVDDQFEDLSTFFQLIKKIKSSRKEILPCFFLTGDSKKIAVPYQKILSEYYEYDEYANFKFETYAQIEAKLKNAMEKKGKIPKKHYNVSIPIRIYVPSEGKNYTGKLLSFSLFAAIISCEQMASFVKNAKVQIKIPTSRFLSKEKGEFMSLYSNIERVHLNGKTAEISYVNQSLEKQKDLTQLLLKMTSRKLA